MTAQHLRKKSPAISSFQFSKKLLVLVAILLLIGVIAVFEASTNESLQKFNQNYYLFRRHIQWLVVALISMIISSFFSVKWIKILSPALYAVGVGLLLALFIPNLGVTINGATRWLSIGGFEFQPVEIMKIGIVTFFPAWLSKHQRLTPFLVLTLFPAVLVMMQPDLGSTLILLSISFGIYILANAQIKTLVPVISFGLLLLMMIIIFSPYRRERLLTFLDPQKDPYDTGYHMRQITIALGNGGVFGKGLGQSRQRHYIPEASTDSIFAIIAEETGLLGSAILIILFATFVTYCFHFAKSLQPQSYEYLLALGITLWFSSQIILNLSAVVALVPLTGIPLPFISRGGTALVTMLSMIGILISIERTIRHNSH